VPLTHSWLHIVCKVGNITYDEQTHMRTINGKLNALKEGVVSL
jgi:hypothetical protein